MISVIFGKGTIYLGKYTHATAGTGTFLEIRLVRKWRLVGQFELSTFPLVVRGTIAVSHCVTR